MSNRRTGLYILRVTKPGTPAVEKSLTLNIVGYDAAQTTARTLERQGYNVDWQSHGYSLYRSVDEAVEAIKWSF